MRRKLYNIIDKEVNTPAAILYNFIMFAAIALTIIPLMTRQERQIYNVFEFVGCGIFVVDYLAKWFTADLHSKHNGIKAFVLYPLTLAAIFDLMTILPTLHIINRSLVSLRVLRLFKTLRLLRILQRSSHVEIIANVIRKEAAILANVLALCVIYIFTTALIMYNYEHTIKTFLDAVYWATTALTTIGYGDISPTSDSAKIISMISSLFGIAIIALPSGIITAGYLEELNIRRQNKK